MGTTSVLKRIWLLILLCIKGPGGKVALVYAAIVLALNLVEIQIGLKMITWNKDFYAALGNYDAQAAVWQIGVFVVLVAIVTAQYVISTYIRELIQIRWRTILTNEALSRWMNNKAYWHLNSSDSSALDNPDQRIAEDCRVMVEKLAGKGLDLFTGIIGLIVFVRLLWELSAFSLEFSLLGIDFSIDHYIVWVAPVYVLICSGLTHWLGYPLMRLNVIQKQREADLRFALTRWREAKEAVALESGEGFENEVALQRYARVVQNWRRRINREFLLGCMNRPYMYSVLRLPLFLAFPAYFVGHVALGGLMELSAAFMRVVTGLSWFIFSYKDLAELAASSNRLAIFFDAADEVAKRPPAIAKEYSTDGALHIKNLNIRDPQGKTLMSLPELTVKPGEAVWVEGPSGMGKSTLLKSIAGIWPHCDGQILLPQGKKLFLPQKPYLPLGNLMAVIAYPGHFDDKEEARSLLKQVGLSKDRHLDLLNQQDNVTIENTFSGGEQQRLIIARILKAKPDWVFLDEATSALDAQAEKQLYTLLRESLPEAGFIVIAHRKPTGLGELKHVQL